MPDIQPSHSGLGEVLRLSWPASLSMLNRTMFQFIDSFLVAGLGATAFNAQFLGGFYALVPESLAFGMMTAVNTFVGQNLGAGRFRQCGRYAWSGMALACLFSLLIMPTAFLAGPFFAWMGHAEHGMEAMYFRYMILCVPLSQGAMALQQFFFGIGRPKVVLRVSIIANIFNVVANWALIYGHWGLPAMGLEGSAIGIVMTFGLMFIILLAVFLSHSFHEKFGTHFWRSVRWRHVLDLARVGWPAGVQFTNDILPWAIFTSSLAGRFGVEHRSALAAAMRWMSVSFMPAVGIGTGVTALVGRYIGQGLPDVARRRAHTGLKVAMTYMGICGMLFFLLGRQMVGLFVSIAPAELGNSSSPEMIEQIVTIGGHVMICAAVFQIFDAVGIVYVGALRGAGDTFWPMVITAVCSWGLVVGGGWCMATFVPQWTSVGPWIAASLYVIVLGIVLAMRFESGSWRKIDLLGRNGVG